MIKNHPLKEKQLNFAKLNELFESQSKEFDKLFAYFYDQIDPMTQNGSVNSELEKINSADDLIDYYNKNMTVRDLKSWERKSP